MASSKGTSYRKKLPLACSPGGTVSKKIKSEQPMDLMEESLGNTGSVSSEDSYSQSTAKLDCETDVAKCPPKFFCY